MRTKYQKREKERKNSIKIHVYSNKTKQKRLIKRQATNRGRCKRKEGKWATGNHGKTERKKMEGIVVRKKT